MMQVYYNPETKQFDVFDKDGNEYLPMSNVVIKQDFSTSGGRDGLLNITIECVGNFVTERPTKKEYD